MEVTVLMDKNLAKLFLAIEASDLASVVSTLTLDPDLTFEEVTGHTVLHRAILKAAVLPSPDDQSSSILFPTSCEEPSPLSSKAKETSCSLYSLDQRLKTIVNISDVQPNVGDDKKNRQCTCCMEERKSPDKSSATAIVKELLDKGASVHLSDANKKRLDPPLIMAVKGGNYLVVKLLLGRGAYVDDVCARGENTALTLAAKLDRHNLVSLLLENYADANKCAGLFFVGMRWDNFFRTAIYAALKNGNSGSVEALLKYGSDIHMERALEIAVLRSDARMLQVLLQHKDSEGEVTSIWGAQNVRLACQRGHLDILDVLLEAGANANCADRQGRTPLMLASKPEIARSLLNHGANPSAEFTVSKGYNRTVLETVINNGWISVADVLVQSGARVTNLTLAQAIAMKKCKGKTELISLLLEAGALANFVDSCGTPVLHIAAYQEPSVLATLVHFGADLNRQDGRGDTVMMSCVRRLQHGSFSILTSLLSLGGNVNFVDAKTGQSVMSILMDQALIDVKEWYKCVQEIQKYGASGTKNCNSALTMSIQKYKTEAVKLIMKSGTGPGFATHCDIYKTVSMSILQTLQGRVTPFLLALLTGKSPIAEFFLDNLFLTTWDISTLAGRNEKVRCMLQDHQHLDCLALLDRRLGSKPLSLFDLTFVTVSTALGPAPGRERRVRNTGLPPVVQRKLLFQHDH